MREAEREWLQKRRKEGEEGRKKRQRNWERELKFSFLAETTHFPRRLNDISFTSLTPSFPLLRQSFHRVSFFPLFHSALLFFPSSFPLPRSLISFISLVPFYLSSFSPSSSLLSPSFLFFPRSFLILLFSSFLPFLFSLFFLFCRLSLLFFSFPNCFPSLFHFLSLFSPSSSFLFPYLSSFPPFRYSLHFLHLFICSLIYASLLFSFLFFLFLFPSLQLFYFLFSFFSFLPLILSLSLPFLCLPFFYFFLFFL